MATNHGEVVIEDLDSGWDLTEVDGLDEPFLSAPVAVARRADWQTHPTVRVEAYAFRKDPNRRNTVEINRADLAALIAKGHPSRRSTTNLAAVRL